MKEFTYRGTARLGVFITQMGGVVTIVLCMLLVVWLLTLKLPPDASIWTMGCLEIWALVLGWTIGLTQINSAPTVWIEDQGLVISAFLFKRVKIPWTEIVDVGAGRVPFGHVLVRARRITPFHRAYGWLYSRTLLPSFLIRWDIQDRDELLHEIRKRLEMRR
jgi:hypothetical protein